MSQLRPSQSRDGVLEWLSSFRIEILRLKHVL